MPSESLPPSLTKCWRILGGAWVAAEIQQAAFLEHRNHPREAEQHRVNAGYGGLTGKP